MENDFDNHQVPFAFFPTKVRCWIWGKFFGQHFGLSLIISTMRAWYLMTGKAYICGMDFVLPIELALALSFGYLDIRYCSPPCLGYHVTVKY